VVEASVLMVMVVVTVLVPVTLAEAAAQVGFTLVVGAEATPEMVQVSATVPVKPFDGVTVTVEFAEAPGAAMVTPVAVRVNLGIGAVCVVMAVKPRVWMTVPAAFFPVTTTL
jgi:hypothetical protein